MIEINTDSNVMVKDQLAAGAHWSMIVRRGVMLRLTDPQGGANVSMLMYNAHEKLERYNAPDTLKAQHTFKLTQGHCLYSDMGRIICSITGDTVGWHDTVGGFLSEKKLQNQYPHQSYQAAQNDWNISAEHAFSVELAKHGLSHRDISANLNLFSKVVIDSDGKMQYVANNSRAGDHIDLRFEMDALVILATCPHPMNSAGNYPKLGIDIELHKAPPPADDDLCQNACPENQRGFQNNHLYHLTGGY